MPAFFMNKIYIVEGIWHTGKSTLINNMRDLYGVIAIAEPVHLYALEPLNSQSAIDAWYIQAHMKNLENAYALVKQKLGNVFIERSILSSIAFTRAYNTLSFDTENYLEKFAYILNKIYENTGEPVRIIYLQPYDLELIKKHVERHSYLRKFNHDKSIRAYNQKLDQLIQEINVEQRAKILIDPTMEKLDKEMNSHV